MFAFIVKLASRCLSFPLKRARQFTNDVLGPRQNATACSLACVASVPVRSERNSGHAKEFFAFGPREIMGREQKLEGRGWGTPPPSFQLLLSPHYFARPECEKLLRVARISFASNRNACYAGYLLAGYHCITHSNFAQARARLV